MRVELARVVLRWSCGSEVPAIVDAEFLHAPVEMRLDGPHGEHETVSDLGVAQPLASEVDELRLASRQVDRGGVETVDRRQLAALVGNVQLPGASGGAAG